MNNGCIQLCVCVQTAAISNIHHTLTVRAELQTGLSVLLPIRFTIITVLMGVGWRERGELNQSNMKLKTAGEEKNSVNKEGNRMEEERRAGGKVSICTVTSHSYTSQLMKQRQLLFPLNQHTLVKN